MFENLTVNMEAGIPGVSLKVGSKSQNDPMLGLSEWLEQDHHPLLFTLTTGFRAFRASWVTLSTGRSRSIDWDRHS